MTDPEEGAAGLKRCFRPALFALVLLLAAVYLYRAREIVADMFLLSPRLMAMLYLFVGLFFLLLGLQFKLQMKMFKKALPFREWFGLTIVNTMLNYLLPARGGVWLKGAYLKRRHRFPFASFVPLVIVSNLVLLSAAALTGISALLLAGTAKGKSIPWGYLGILAMIFVLTVLVPTAGRLVAPVLRRGFRWKLPVFLRNLQEGFAILAADRGLLALLLVLNVALVVTAGLRYYVCLRIFGAGEADPFVATAVQSLAAFTIVVSITPGNIGLKEGVVGLCYSMMDVSFDVAMLAAIADRAAAMSVVFFLGPVCNQLILRSGDPSREA